MKGRACKIIKVGDTWGCKCILGREAHSGSWEGGILHGNILSFYTVVMDDDEEELRTHHSGYLGAL